MLADPPTSQCSGAAAHPRRRTRNVQLRRVEVCGALSGRTHASECPGARNAAAAPRAHGCLDSAVRSSAPKPRRGASWPSSGYDRAKDDRVQHSIRARRSGAQDAELIALRLERVVPLAVSVCRRTGRRFRRMWGGQRSTAHTTSQWAGIAATTRVRAGPGGARWHPVPSRRGLGHPTAMS